MKIEYSAKSTHEWINCNPRPEKCWTTSPSRFNSLHRQSQLLSPLNTPSNHLWPFQVILNLPDVHIPLVYMYTTSPTSSRFTTTATAIPTTTISPMIQDPLTFTFKTLISPTSTAPNLYFGNVPSLTIPKNVAPHLPWPSPITSS